MLNRLNISNLPAIPRKEIFERSFATRVEAQGAWNKSKTSSPEVLPRGKKKKKERKKERKREKGRLIVPLVIRQTSRNHWEFS